MIRVFCGRWLTSSVVATLAFAAVQVLASAEARAGCGHPWVQGSGLSASLLDLSLVGSGVDPTPIQPASHRPSDRSGPCAGGACSRSPELPLSSTVEITPDGDHWGDLPADLACSPPGSRVFAPEDDRRRPARLPTAIERPPRLSPAR
jgi:hypothetical protein